jgi:hypothetical protein
MQSASGASETMDRVRTAQRLLKQDRQQGLAALNELFRAGHPPETPLDGPYRGELVAVDIAPVVTQLVESLTAFWMPWKGKFLVRDETKGDNLFGQGSRLILRVLYPFYSGFVDHDAAVFRGFVFQTSIGAGREDTDRQVLKIDYASPVNPRFTIRRILDEVVQVEEGVYLGKIHFHAWWGTWKMIGYFSLRPKQP